MKCWVEDCRTVAVRHVFLQLCATHLADAELSTMQAVYRRFPPSRLMESMTKYERRFGVPAQGPAVPLPNLNAPTEAVQRYRATTHEPVVYFVVTGDRVKIGTTTNLTHRLRSLSLPSDAEVQALIPGDGTVERRMHQRFAADRIGDSEWFHLSRVLAAFIREQDRHQVWSA